MVEHFHDKVIEYVDPRSTAGGKLTREEAYFTNQKLGQIRSLPRGAAFESPDVADTAYADGRVAREAIKRLGQAAERFENGTPFFMAVGFARPHLPFSAPKKYWDAFDPEALPLPEFEVFPANSPMVAHNASFDFGFLNNELTLCGRDIVSLERMVDTVALARKRHPGAKLSLDALCTRYGIDRSHRVKHGALLDAELLAQVYLELKGGRQIGLLLASDAATSSSAEVGQAASAVAKKPTKERREPRPHAATAAELERHAEFVGTIENALWRS